MKHWTNKDGRIVLKRYPIIDMSEELLWDLKHVCGMDPFEEAERIINVELEHDSQKILSKEELDEVRLYISELKR